MPVKKPKHHKKPSKPAVPNPLKLDPTQTTTLRRKFVQEIGKGFAALSRAIQQLVTVEDAFGLKTTTSLASMMKTPRPVKLEMPNTVATANGQAPTTNKRWQFATNPDKINAFQEWLKSKLDSYVRGKSQEELWKAYVLAGMKKGAGRAFDDAKKKERVAAELEKKMPFYQGTREEFLRSALRQPVAVEKVQLIAERAFDELENLTADMANKLARALADGLVQGKGPLAIARDIVDQVGIAKERAETIARTELIRAHAEAQLIAMEQMGIDEVGVMVEWQATPDHRLCQKCASMAGVVLKIEEAHGMIPRHPRCRCAWVPANVGESSRGQKRSKTAIDKAIAASGKEDGWGAAIKISKERPEGPVENVRRRPRLSRALVEFSRLLQEPSAGPWESLDAAVVNADLFRVEPPVAIPVQVQTKAVKVPDEVLAFSRAARKPGALPWQSVSGATVNADHFRAALPASTPSPAADPTPEVPAEVVEFSRNKAPLWGTVSRAVVDANNFRPSPPAPANSHVAPPAQKVPAEVVEFSKLPKPGQDWNPFADARVAETPPSPLANEQGAVSLTKPPVPAKKPPTELERDREERAKAALNDISTWSSKHDNHAGEQRSDR